MPLQVDREVVKEGERMKALMNYHGGHPYETLQVMPFKVSGRPRASRGAVLCCAVLAAADVADAQEGNRVLIVIVGKPIPDRCELYVVYDCPQVTSLTSKSKTLLCFVTCLLTSLYSYAPL